MRLLTTETPRPAQLAVAAVPQPLAGGLTFGDPICVEYDDYQSAAMAFYSLSAIVQDGLDSAAAESTPESGDSAVARFEQTVRCLVAGELVTAPNPIEELAMLWVASDGCMH